MVMFVSENHKDTFLFAKIAQSTTMEFAFMYHNY